VRRLSSFVFGAVLMASTPMGAAAGAPELNSVTASKVDQLNGQISNQLGMVESASSALTEALRSLSEAQKGKPDRNAARYWVKDKDGNKIFRPEMFDADMSKWQGKITRLTNEVNQKQAKLAQEESKLGSLQSRMSDAAGRDNRSRMDALEDEKRKLKNQ
jgi:chromosome segregation ATPase